MQEVLMFGEYTGLQLNRGKTKTLPLNFDNSVLSICDGEHSVRGGQQH